MDIESLVPEAGNLAGFIEQFEVFANAPDGVEKIRSLIYQLAVKGKLVANSTEEIASSYLGFLESERDILVSSQKSKKTKLDITNIIEPFPLPKCWKWVYLDSISQDIHYGYTASANQGIKDIRLLRITDIQNNKVNWNSVPGCLIDDKQYLSNSLEAGDLLIARTGGTVGKSYLVENISVKAVFASYLIRVKPLKSTWRKYLKLFTLSPLYWEQLIDKTSGSAQPNVNATSLKSMLVPIPPLEEQKRIVAKVDELMALCDKLEAQQQQQANTVLRANTAAINALLNPSTAETSFEQNWQRIAQHFNTLYGCTLPMPKGEGRKKKHLVGLGNVKALRQMILQLAIMGKLISHNFVAETAKELNKVILLDKELLVKNGEIKKQKDSVKISNTEMPFTLNSNSVWVRLQNLVYLLGDGLHGTPTYTEETEYYFINGNNLNNGKIVIKHNTKTVSKEEMERHKKNLTPNTVFVSINGTLGNVAFYNQEKIMLGKSACYFNLSERIEKKFMKIVIQSPYFKSYALSQATGSTIKNLSLKSMNNLPIPLPPLEEQKRIVAKVDQLMTLCDQLEQQLTQSYSDAEKLMQATVKALVA